MLLTTLIEQIMWATLFGAVFINPKQVERFYASMHHVYSFNIYKNITYMDWDAIILKYQSLICYKNTKFYLLYFSLRMLRTAFLFIFNLLFRHCPSDLISLSRKIYRKDIGSFVTWYFTLLEVKFKAHKFRCLKTL